MGIIEREKWIVESFIEKFWENLSEEEKLKLLKNIERDLKGKGVDINMIRMAILGNASITILRTILGFQFHIFLAQIANHVAKFIFNRGLSFFANAALQRTAGLIFGPVGWILFIVSLLDIFSSLVNPREYDKFIPIVFLIGLYRNYLEIEQI